MFTQIYTDSDIKKTTMNNEGCHRLPFGRNATKTAKCINAKLGKRKHSEAMLQQKKSINTKSKVFVSHFVSQSHLLKKFLMEIDIYLRW